MSLTRRIPIQYKIFTAETLAALLNELSSIYNADEWESRNHRYRLTVNVDEHATAKTDAPPRDIDTFLQTPIYHLGLTISNYETDRNFEFTLIPGASESASKILIESNDEDWVNLEHGKLCKLLESVKPQSTFIKNHFWWLGCALGFLIGWPLQKLLLAIALNGHPDASASLGGRSFLALMAGVLPAFWLLSYAREKAFPVIEVQTGPTHGRKPEQTRQRLKLLFAAVILGPMGNLIYDLCKTKLL